MTALPVRFLLFLWSIASFAVRIDGKTSTPNIVVILSDDMGWHDVGFHGSNLVRTPNIDALAYNGVVLRNLHSSSLCTPSRSALFSGKFPIFIGMQRLVILEAEPWGLPLHLKILPQYLKEVGYATHLVGKWHLGFFKRDYTPTKRGFDSFYGYWQGHQNYYTHESHETYGPFNGYDMHNNLETDWDNKSIYSTDLFATKATEIIFSHDVDKPLFLMLSQIAPHAGGVSEPLQAPAEEIAKFNYIEDEKKRTYAAMVSKLDESVGEVVKALAQKNMLENTVILFMSDNGAPTSLNGPYGTTGSNYPFRGAKGTEWEGGTRIPAVIWSPLLRSNRQRISNIMMHMVDVLPTLLTVAGINTENVSDIDGISMWDILSQGSEDSPRTEYPSNIDPSDETTAVGAVTSGEWKYIQGNENFAASENNGWLGDKYGNDAVDKIDYDFENVINSSLNLALTELYTKFAHRENEIPDYGNDKHTSSGGEHPSILTELKIQQLRNETRITCPPQLPWEEVCKPEIAPCLVNLNEDPCERHNLASKYPVQFAIMRQKFEDYRRKVVRPLNKPRDKCADPAKWNGAWVNWYDYTAAIEHASVRGALCQIKSVASAAVKKVVKFLKNMFNF